MLMLSNVIYDEPMLRFAGLLLAILGNFIGCLEWWVKDFRAYTFSIIARTVLVVFVFWMWMKFENPIFIVLIGLIPSCFVMMKEKVSKNKTHNNLYRPVTP